MRDGPTNWIDDTSDEAPGTRRRPALLLVAASVPWLVVVALLALPGRLGGVNGAAPHDPGVSLRDAGSDDAPADAGSGDTPSDTTPAGPSPTDSGSEAGAATPPPHQPQAPTETSPARPPDTSETPLALTEHRGRWRTEAGPEEAAALAVAVARAWLTGLSPPLHVDGVSPEADDRYAEHVVVEAVEQPGPEAAVVTLLAVVLEGDDLSARVRRLAVPIAWEQGSPRPAGQPWWLPGPTLDPLVPDTEPVDDPDEYLAVLDALAAAGLEDAEVHHLGATSGWPVVAEVTATTGGGDRIAGPVWLRRHLDGYVVAGTAAASSEAQPGGGMEPDP